LEPFSGDSCLSVLQRRDNYARHSGYCRLGCLVLCWAVTVLHCAVLFSGLHCVGLSWYCIVRCYFQACIVLGCHGTALCGAIFRLALCWAVTVLHCAVLFAGLHCDNDLQLNSRTLLHFSLTQQPNASPGRFICVVSRSHTMAHHRR
jgi:hypothetical protein